MTAVTYQAFLPNIHLWLFHERSYRFGRSASTTSWTDLTIVLFEERKRLSVADLRPWCTKLPEIAAEAEFLRVQYLCHSERQVFRSLCLQIAGDRYLGSSFKSSCWFHSRCTWLLWRLRDSRSCFCRKLSVDQLPKDQKTMIGAYQRPNEVLN